jgi:hypothetical protein
VSKIKFVIVDSDGKFKQLRVSGKRAKKRLAYVKKQILRQIYFDAERERIRKEAADRLSETIRSQLGIPEQMLKDKFSNYPQAAWLYRATYGPLCPGTCRTKFV